MRSSTPPFIKRHFEDDTNKVNKCNLFENRLKLQLNLATDKAG